MLHGSLSYVLQNGDGQTANVHSCSAGLDYPGVGPEHSYWKDNGRVTCAATDKQALDAFTLLANTEGIIPALETSHAIAEGVRLAATMKNDQHLVINCSGRRGQGRGRGGTASRTAGEVIAGHCFHHGDTEAQRDQGFEAAMPSSSTPSLCFSCAYFCVFEVTFRSPQPRPTASE